MIAGVAEDVEEAVKGINGGGWRHNLGGEHNTVYRLCVVKYSYIKLYMII